MDHTDKKILSLLQSNARISNAELAEKVNLSPTPCLRRMRRLEEKGMIRNYRAILDEKNIHMVPFLVGEFGELKTSRGQIDIVFTERVDKISHIFLR